jgi:hypothetical protein
MKTELKCGQLVTALAYGGERLKRRVVSILDRTVVICTEDEFHKAALVLPQLELERAFLR